MIFGLGNPGRQTAVGISNYASAFGRSAGFKDVLIVVPGLTPRALCFRALRALSTQVGQIQESESCSAIQRFINDVC
jgi:hypothetical protein